METGIITAVIALIIAFSITLSERSIFDGKFSNSIVSFFGKSTLVLFMNHLYWFYYLEEILGMLNINVSKLCFNVALVLMIILSSLVTFFIGTIIKNWANKFLRKL